MFTVVTCITQEHDPQLLIAALAICAIAGVASMNLLACATAASGRMRLPWIAASACAFGGGIWATHFIAMLAFISSTPLSFAPGMTVLSMLGAMACMLPAFILASDPRSGYARRIVGGLLTGGTIAGMHYLGMSALRLDGIVIWDPTLVAASLLACAIPAVAACLLFSDLSRPAVRLAAAILLCVAIINLHFTGVAAATFLPSGGPGTATALQDRSPLAIGIAMTTLLILLIFFTSAIVDRRFADQAARQARRFRQLADATLEGVLIHRGGVVLDANHALCRLLDQPAAAIIGQPLSALFAPESIPPLLAATGQDSEQTSEIDMTFRDGTVMPVELRTRGIDHDGAPAQVALMHDLRRRRAIEEHIRYLARHDALTGLANRFMFNDRLNHAIAQASREPNGKVAVLSLDLNRFKLVNDLMGHAAGDVLLQNTARRVIAAVGNTGTVARLGGDEFAIIQVGQPQPSAADALATRLAAELAQPHEIDGQSVSLSTSIGIAIFPTDAADRAALLQQADSALYRARLDAKHDSRSTVRFFEPTMDLQVQQRRELARDLSQAIGTRQMELHYQPVMRGADRSLAGYEALLRWHHPRHGSISPAAFIPLAEESGSIIQLGLWVLETACTEAASWHPGLSIAVNISPAQFRRADLVDNVAAILARTGLAPTRLELEVTEGVLIDHADHALDTLLRLMALGVGIALDDFGTGYSSLSYLSRFPFDKIKIDQSFVRDMLDDPNARAIVLAVIGLGRTLHREVTAEGVETEAQACFLQDHGCDRLQGYLLGRPRPAGALSSLESAR